MSNIKKHINQLISRKISPTVVWVPDIRSDDKPSPYIEAQYDGEYPHEITIHTRLATADDMSDVRIRSFINKYLLRNHGCRLINNISIDRK